eukprot:7170732-Alexandrium_andersonii.AAC.1
MGQPVVDQVVPESAHTQRPLAARPRQVDVEGNAVRLEQTIHHSLEIPAHGVASRLALSAPH